MRVVIADDMMLLRRGVVDVLIGEGIDVVGEASDALALLQLVEATSPDVAIIDIRMPPSHTTEGLDAAQRIRTQHPGVAVLVLSQYVQAGYALRLIEDEPAGVGYLIKERVLEPEVLTDALRRVRAGQTVVDPTIVAQMLSRLRRNDPLHRLSDREREVLSLVAEGLSNIAIARRLFITTRTVEWHVSSLFSKLDITEGPDHHRRVLAVLAFLER